MKYIYFVICKDFQFGLVKKLLFGKEFTLSKLKAFVDDKINESQIEILVRKRRKHGKRRKCWTLAFSLFHTMCSKGLLLTLYHTIPTFNDPDKEAF